MKRAFDIVLSSLGLFVMAPVLALISILVVTLNGRPVLFRQKRVGYKGNAFVMYKFRTMVRNAEALGKPLTVGDDPRITKLGIWLRKTKLDELPQLFNVLLGQMSLVGPRPEVERYVAYYTLDQRRVLNLVPGITDPASIRYRHESELLKTVADPERTYIEEILPDKIRINLEYASHRNLLHDCGVILRTVGALFSAEHIPGESSKAHTLARVAGGDGRKSANSLPRVSVIVPCRNERNHIEACLRSILDQIEPPGGMEVLVVDGMSDDGTRELLRSSAATDTRVRLIDNPRQITPVALNLGINCARGQIIVRMDAHTEYSRDYVLQCVETLQQTGADNVGGPARTKAVGYVQRAIAAAHHSPFSSGGAAFHRADYEGEVDTVFYGCWRKDKLIQIGLFDEELVRNQDDELNYRITKSGGRLWQSPQIRCWYSPRKSLAGLFKQYMQYGFWKVRVIQKHSRPASFRHLVPVIFVLGLALGWLPGLLYSPLGILYAGLTIAYGILSVVFSAHTAAKANWTIFPILPAVFFVYHLSYGLGFAVGLINFHVLSRAPSATASGEARHTAVKSNRAAA
jgi:succinoglycan biosynthesis protein ExoA